MTDYPRHPTTYSRAKLFSDGSGVQLGVTYRPTLKLCDTSPVVEIAGVGVGDSILVYTKDIDQLISWLYEAQRIAQATDEEA